MRLFLILLFTLALQYAPLAQSVDRQTYYKAIYKMTYQLDSLDSTSKKTDMMELLFNDSTTIFQSTNKGFRDSVNILNRKSNPDYNINRDPNFKQLPRMNNYFTIKRKKNDITVLDTYSYGGIMSDGYQSYNEKLTHDWKLTNKTDTLFGYSAQQATVEFAGRKWVAWFTQDIPVDAGPYKFFGLPGLILQVQDEQGYWQFVLTNLTPSIKREILSLDKMSNDVLLTDKLTYFKNRKYYLENRTILDVASKNIIIESNDIRQEYIKKDAVNAAKHNNWIERYP